MRVPAVVGSFPEPFASGIDGRKLPVRLVCLDGEDDAVRRGRDAARRTPASTTSSRSVLEQSAGREVLRVLVGPWREVRARHRRAQARVRPRGVGRVRAAPTAPGDRIDLLDERGRESRTLGRGGGLLAATRIEAQQPTWVVTGVDAAGVAAAAAALTEERARRTASRSPSRRAAAVPLPADRRSGQ